MSAKQIRIAIIGCFAISTIANSAVVTSRAELQRAISAATKADKAPILTREAFLRLAPISDVKLSPDGRYLVYRQRREQQTDLMCRDLHSDTVTRVLSDIHQLSVEWANQGSELWLADQNGLATYSLTKRQSKRILKWDQKREQRFWGVDSNAHGYVVLREKVAEASRWTYRAVRVNNVGKVDVILESQQPLRGVLLNHDGSLAYATVYDGEQYDSVVRRYQVDSNGKITEHELLRCQGADNCNLLYHDQKRNAVWIITHHGEDRSALKRWQSGQKGKGTWITEFNDPAQLADVASVLWHSDRNEWLGIAFHPDRRHWYGSDPTRTQQLKTLQKQLPDSSLTLTSSDDASAWLVQAKHAQWQWDRYFLYEPATTKLRELFLAEYRDSPPFVTTGLAPAIPLHYRARDGFLVHGYVYLPLGVDTARVPLIAHIHGGPFNRDRDTFNGIVQLLVNRGYAVFTPNFRASTGYGRQYLHAPQGDFGRSSVLLDIVDGMDFVLANGIGDPQQQAVSGHSFGAYASLMAVSHFPERFRLAFASAPPTDFNWVMKEIVENGGSALPDDAPPGEIFLRHHGVRFNDVVLREKMHKESPLAMLSRLKTPIYLWAGASDDRVPLKSVLHYAAETKRHQKDIALLIDPQAGHSPESPLGVEALVYWLEAATARQLGGVASPASPTLQSFLNKNTRIAPTN